MQSWGARLMESLDKAWKYVEEQGRDVEENRATWSNRLTSKLIIL